MSVGVGCPLPPAFVWGWWVSSPASLDGGRNFSKLRRTEDLQHRRPANGRSTVRRSPCAALAIVTIAVAVLRILFISKHSPSSPLPTHTHRLHCLACGVLGLATKITATRNCSRGSSALSVMQVCGERRKFWNLFHFVRFGSKMLQRQAAERNPKAFLKTHFRPISTSETQEPESLQVPPSLPSSLPPAPCEAHTHTHPQPLPCFPSWQRGHGGGSGRRSTGWTSLRKEADRPEAGWLEHSALVIFPGSGQKKKPQRKICSIPTYTHTHPPFTPSLWGSDKRNMALPEACC